MITNHQISPETTFLVEYLNLPEATGMPEATWEAFQIRHLNNTKLLAITNKSRQVGWSWLAAAEAVAKACLTRRSTCIFVSINLDEAGEKIRYAKGVIEALDRDVRPKLTIENRLEIELTNGSRLISHPCRPVRGKARAWVYLDEFAHYAKDREIYQSAVPVISKGGAIRVGSSPLGAGGMFWEIYSQTMKPYPGFIRDAIPWWHVRALCKDTRQAARLAPLMETDERTRTFGSPRLLEIYENMILEDFQQEYECSWVDESVAWIDWELIKRNQALDQAGDLWFTQVKTLDAALAVADTLAAVIRDGRIESVLVGGMDIGRKHDTTEIILLGLSTTGQTPYRCGITLDRVEFDDQAAVVNRLMERLPISALHIDQNGIGMQLAENAQRRWGPRVQPAEFTNASKTLWAVEAKLRFQRGEVPIPTDRDLAYQIHSIKRKITASKNTVFDVDANAEHHADKFWALALAVWAGKNPTGADDWIGTLKRMNEERRQKEAENEFRKTVLRGIRRGR